MSSRRPDLSDTQPRLRVPEPLEQHPKRDTQPRLGQPNLSESQLTTETQPRIRQPDSTYSRIIERAIIAVHREKGIANKLRGFTREISALGAQTRHQIGSMSPGRRIALYLSLVAFGAIIALSASYLALRSSPDEIRTQARAEITAGNFDEARSLLTQLRARVGDLTEEDRWALVAPIQAWSETRAEELKLVVEEERRAGRWASALRALAEIEELGVDIEWALFTHGETLRAAGRKREAAEIYRRFATLFPNTEESDDAIFWAALMHRDLGDETRMQAMLRELLDNYPRSNFGTSTRRLLSELEATE